jgi:hypothetical protein
MNSLTPLRTYPLDSYDGSYESGYLSGLYFLELQVSDSPSFAPNNIENDHHCHTLNSLLLCYV